jgi:hypothetical protein
VKLAMGRATRRFWIAVAIFAAIGLSFVRTGGADQGDTWYWTEQYAADRIFQNGIRWGSINRMDGVRRDTCWGLGDTYTSGGQVRYRHFYCRVWPTNDRPYAIILHVLGQTVNRVTWDQYLADTTWYWSAQRVANALVVNGITWPGGHDLINSDACTSYGKIYKGQYQHFYCLVTSTTGGRYATVVHVLNQRQYRVTYIDTETKPAAPVGDQQRALREQGNATLTNMTIQTTHFNNQIMFGTPYPPMFGPPSGP